MKGLFGSSRLRTAGVVAAAGRIPMLTRMSNSSKATCCHTFHTSTTGRVLPDKDHLACRFNSPVIRTAARHWKPECCLPRLTAFCATPSLIRPPYDKNRSARMALMQRVLSGDMTFADACKNPHWDSFRTNDGSPLPLNKGMIFSGNSNPELAQAICTHLGISLGNANVGRFADGEVRLQISDSLRGKDVYIVQPTSTPVNEHLMELLLMISTCKRASASHITAVIPYYGYARQDRKLSSRVPISAADVARMIEAMGVDRVISVDLHCGQIQGFFGPHVPVDNLESQLVALEYFAPKDLRNPVIVSPDAGGVYRVKKFQEGLRRRGIESGVAMIIKQRHRPNEIERMDLVGNVSDCDAIIVDDMIDTAGTLSEAANQLKKHGARKVYAFATHGLFNGPAIERIEKSNLEEVLVTDSTKLPKAALECSKIKQASISLILADVIRRINFGESLQQLFIDGLAAK